MEQILSILMALTAPEPDSSYFNHLLQGGVDGQAPVTITACPRPLARSEVERETAICGLVTVPEDHDDPNNGETVDLSFAILRANTTYPLADPLVYLHGGPGMGNLAGGIEGLAGLFGKFRETRDVIAFDERAAGLSSGSIACYEAMTTSIDAILTGEVDVLGEGGDGAPQVSDFFAACLEEIATEGTDLTKYNTRQNALDVPAVLRALGYEEWNIYGISYGTKLTMEVLRQSPEGTRSVVIDGVAPAWIPTYDTLAVPPSESMQRLVEDCAAEPACAEAYPDLGDVIRDVMARANAGEIMMDGEAIPSAAVTMAFEQRNIPRPHSESLTPYLPAIFYEFHRGGDMPTVDMVYDEWRFTPPAPTAGSLEASLAETLTAEQTGTLRYALKDAEIVTAANAALDLAVDELRSQLRRDRELGPLPSLFDAELSSALPDSVNTPERARAALRDYARLQSGTPSRERLVEFVTTHFDGPHLSRLQSIVTAMTEQELAAVFDYVAEEIQLGALKFQQSIDLQVYVCQEDFPFNTMEGFKSVSADLPFDFGAQFEDVAQQLYNSCEVFQQVERDNWHDVVKSDVPTLSIGSGWDVQTAASWAVEATQGLTNAQSFLIAEAGHGAIIYQPCVRDLTAAFVDDPMRVLDDSCERAAAVPLFYIAPWVKTAEE